MTERKKYRIEQLTARTFMSESCPPPVPTVVAESKYWIAALRRCTFAARAFAKALLTRIDASFRHMRQQRTTRSLRVRETAPLGEKRFVAIVDADGERFLIGGAASSVALLARLREQKHTPPHFASILHQFECEGETIQ